MVNGLNIKDTGSFFPAICEELFPGPIKDETLGQNSSDRGLLRTIETFKMYNFTRFKWGNGTSISNVLLMFNQNEPIRYLNLKHKHTEEFIQTLTSPRKTHQTVVPVAYEQQNQTTIAQELVQCAYFNENN